LDQGAKREQDEEKKLQDERRKVNKEIELSKMKGNLQMNKFEA